MKNNIPENASRMVTRSEGVCHGADFPAHIKASFYVGDSTRLEGHACKSAVTLSARIGPHHSFGLMADDFDTLRNVCRDWLKILDEMEAGVMLADKPVVAEF